MTSRAWKALRSALHRCRPTFIASYADGRPQQAWCRCGQYMGHRDPTPGAIESRQPEWRP